MKHGEAIAARLAQMGKSKRWLAVMGGWSPNAVQKWVNNSGITEDNLATVEKILGTKLARVRPPASVAKDPPKTGRNGMSVSEMLEILLRRLSKAEQDALINEIVDRIEMRAQQRQQTEEEGDGEPKHRSFGSAT